MTSHFVKPEERPATGENGVSDYRWGSLPLAIQLILPLAIITLIIGRRGIGIRPYPVLDTYVSLICPSFKQRQRLLKWMSDRIPHMPNKIGEYWRDGSLLCTLINTAVPGACPNPQRHWHQPPSHGQALAFKYLGVTPMLNEEHFKEKAFASQTEKSFFKYLLTVQDAIAKLDAKENADLKYTSKYIARGMGLFTGEKDRASVFYVYPNSRPKKMQNVLVNLKGPYGTYGTHAISAQQLLRTMDLIEKVQKDVRREQKKLTVPSKAQRSFFRSLSIDLGPLANIIGNRRNSDGIKMKVDVEEGRAKVSFIPPHTGVYELCLTTDGEHLRGSPFNIRVTKNETNVVDSFETNVKSRQLKKTGKIISKCITFINESVRVTNNNNNNTGRFDEPKQNISMTSTEISCKFDEDSNSTEQDSGMYEIMSEIGDFNETQRSEANSLNGKNVEVFIKKRQTEITEAMSKYEDDPEDRKEIPDEVSAITPEEALHVISNMMDFPTKNCAEDSSEDTKDVNDFALHHTNLKQIAAEKSENVNQKDTLDLLGLKSNSEFEDLYNKYMREEETDVRSDTENYGINTELRLLKKVSNVRAVKQIFENDSPKALVNPDLITCHSQNHPKTASPVSQEGIEQEVESPRSPKDATHPSRDGAASSSAEVRKRLISARIVDVSDEVGEINVVEIRAKFESETKTDDAMKTRPSRKNNCNVDLLKETNKHLAVSLPNLIVNDLSGNSLESIASEEESTSLKFRERYQFWKNLLAHQKSSVSGLNLAASDNFIGTKTLSRSTYFLERKSENAAEEVKSELKTHAFSTDEMIFPSVKDKRNYYLSNVAQKENLRCGKVVAATKNLTKQNCDENQRRPDLIYKVLEKVPASNLNPRYRKEPTGKYSEEDIDFTDVMRRRFEKSSRYFKSLEVLPTSKATPRRSSLDERNGTVRKVYDRFSVDNLYRDVMSEKINRNSFKGSPNRSAVAETLASISGGAGSFVEENSPENDPDLKYFRMKKRTKERKSIRSVFDINY